MKIRIAVKPKLLTKGFPVRSGYDVDDWSFN